MTHTGKRSLSKRLKNGAIFVGIVWTLAGSFVAFELLSLSATDLALSNLGTFGNLALSRATQESTACVAGPDEVSRQAATANLPAARVRAWLLGVNFGRDAQTRQWGGAGAVPDKQILENIERLARMLAVPTPEAFTAAQIANANTEFVSFVEGDARGTAHQLTALYSPQACELYKLGAFWGYATLVRIALPGERSIYAVEINYYARRAGLPEALSESLIKATSATASGDELVAETVALTDAVTEHLTTMR